MNKESQHIINDIAKNLEKQKGINPKNQKRKYTRIKKIKNNLTKNKTQAISHLNNNIENNLNKKTNDNNLQEKDNKEKIKDNHNMTNLNNIDIRYFGKNLENKFLDERINQYIIKGNTFKKYFNNNNNCIFNRNINKPIYNLDENENMGNEDSEIINIKYINNPQYVIHYRYEIFQTLLREENNHTPNYCELNEIIPEETRNKYLLFLISVCDKITKKEEIHYLSINIFDRVISKLLDDENILTEKKLQLICITSLFIAYKYETGYYFLIDDLIRHTEDSLVTREEVLKFEYEINNILNFDYLIVYPSHFLKHYDLIDNIDDNKKIYYFCLYLIDFILSDIKLMSHKKSLISASCYYIAKANLLNIHNWPNIFQFVTGYNKNEIKEFSIKIIKTMKSSKNSSIFKCLKKKYSKDEYYNVINCVIGKK